jgi:hypothetical protein
MGGRTSCFSRLIIGVLPSLQLTVIFLDLRSGDGSFSPLALQHQVEVRLFKS